MTGNRPRKRFRRPETPRVRIRTGRPDTQDAAMCGPTSIPTGTAAFKSAPPPPDCGPAWRGCRSHSGSSLRASTSVATPRGQPREIERQRAAALFRNSTFPAFTLLAPCSPRSCRDRGRTGGCRAWSASAGPPGPAARWRRPAPARSPDGCRFETARPSGGRSARRPPEFKAAGRAPAC